MRRRLVNSPMRWAAPAPMMDTWLEADLISSHDPHVGAPPTASLPERPAPLCF